MEMNLGVCDNCKVETKKEASNMMPKGWFCIDRLELLHDGKKWEKFELNAYKKHFCSEECMGEWFKKQGKKMKGDEKNGNR